jgi:hypothetical protein
MVIGLASLVVVMGCGVLWKEVGAGEVFVRLGWCGGGGGGGDVLTAVRERRGWRLVSEGWRADGGGYGMLEWAGDARLRGLGR